jgi:hypothetical protein
MYFNLFVLCLFFVLHGMLSILSVLYFCIISPHVNSWLIFVYNLTDLWHCVETQLQLINIISYHIKFNENLSDAGRLLGGSTRASLRKSLSFLKDVFSVMYSVFFYCYVTLLLLCVTVFILCILLFIVLVFYCVCACNVRAANITEIFRAFSSVVRQMPGHNSQRRGTARTSKVS